MSNNSNFFLLIVSLFFIMSCSSKSSMTVEDFEASLIDHGYTQSMDFNTNADREIQELIKDKKLPMYTDKTSKNYIDYQINYKYYFIGFSDEMINKYVVVSFKDKDGNLKIYENKNINNEKGEQAIIHTDLSDDYYGIQVENPSLYYWDVSPMVDVSNKMVTMEEIEKLLIKKGYEEFTIGESKSGSELLTEAWGKNTNEINIFLDKPQESLFTLYKPKEKYRNFTIETHYNFIGYDNEMINKYVVVKIWGINKDNEYVCKGYEKKNVNNKKGKRYRLNQTLKDFDGKIITNPTLYLWD